MFKAFCTLLLLSFASHSLVAKEYFFRLSSGRIVSISINNNILLSEAIHSGDFESSYESTAESDTIIETQADETNLLNEILSLHANALDMQPYLPESENTIELINICQYPVLSEQPYANKCAIPTCMRRFKSTSSKSKKVAHHKSHFTPEFLESLHGQPVLCPYCSSVMKGSLISIMIHFSRYCPGNN